GTDTPVASAMDAIVGAGLRLGRVGRAVLVIDPSVAKLSLAVLGHGARPGRPTRAARRPSDPSQSDRTALTPVHDLRIVAVKPSSRGSKLSV
ncbi:MAG TPA: hypothetical protein VK194_05420, partial [Candidatus Deferrimicrobium sp.]|nr:hypothetical protein [Candidatus Deferrimicrobium sp.]